jgi:arylsulfatase A-like enzyme
VLTADHGVQPLPRPARRISLGDLASAAGTELSRRYRMDFNLVFDSGLLSADTTAMSARGLNVDSVAAAVATAARRPGVLRVYTPKTLGAAPDSDREASLWRNQLPPGFGWLLLAAIEPGYVWSAPDRTAAEHGSTAELDVTVPVAFMGKGIRGARITRPVRTVDIAPTLAVLLGLAPTERLDGQVLAEVTNAR